MKPRFDLENIGFSATLLNDPSYKIEFFATLWYIIGKYSYVYTWSIKIMINNDVRI